MTDRTRRVKWTIILSLIAVALYCLILLFSRMQGELSSAHSMGVTEGIVSFFEQVFSLDLSYNDSFEQLGALDAFVRKVAHFTEYALLALPVYAIALLWGKRRLIAAILPFAAVVSMAAADEWLQTFVPGRYGSVRDVLLDSAGCLFGMLLLRLLWKNKEAARDGKSHL